MAQSDASCFPPPRGNITNHVFNPLCAECGSIARGGILESFTDGIALFRFLCDTDKSNLGGWSILVENSHHWKILSEKSRGVYAMRPWEPETREKG